MIPVEKGIPKGGVSSGGGGGYQGCLTPEDNFLGICSRELLAKGCELLKRTREGLLLSSNTYDLFHVTYSS